MKNLLLVLSLVITASPAFASRARLESLGEGKNGSYYVNDGRNIFLNPAAISAYKKKMFFEFGTAAPAADSVAASKAQGGFTNTFGDFTYGLYLGRESDRMANLVTALNGANGFNSAVFITPDHALDFFFGGGDSLKWGFDVFYQGGLDSTATTKRTASLFGVKLGVDVSNFQVFTTVGITSSLANDPATATSNLTAKGKISVDLGATYTMDEMTYLAKFTTFGTEVTGGTTSLSTGTTTTPSTMAFGLGAGWKKEASKSVTVYSRVQFDYQADDTKTATAAATTVTASKYYNFPLVVAAEAQATSWLTVRGSIAHSIMGQSQTGGNIKTSLDDTTSVAGGLGLNFGDLTIDGIIGTSTAIAAGGSEMGTYNQSGAQFGLGDTRMMGRLAMTYNF